jgi:integrase
MTSKAAPASINQALAAVTLLYARAGLRITVKRARVPKPGALTKPEQGRVERAAARRGVRDRAIVATLLYAGARAGECGRLDADDVTLTARTGHIRLHGKGDEVRTVPLPPVGREHLAAWLDERGTHDGPLWTGQRGRLAISGITQAYLVCPPAGCSCHQCQTSASRARCSSCSSTALAVAQGLGAQLPAGPGRAEPGVDGRSDAADRRDPGVDLHRNRIAR